MNRKPIPVREKVAAYRARQRAAGILKFTTELPADLIAQIDRLKEERGSPSRAPIVEEALRFYIENQQGA